MIQSARDLKVGGVLCALRFVHVVDFSMSHGGRGECCRPTAPGLPLSVMLTGVWDGVDLASPPIKRNLNICQGTIDDADDDSTMSCKKHIILRDIRLHSPNLLLY